MTRRIDDFFFFSVFDHAGIDKDADAGKTMRPSDDDSLHTTVRSEVTEAVVFGEQTGIDARTDEYAAVGKDSNTFVRLTSQLVEERGHTRVEVAIALSVGGREVHVVVEPLPDGGILALDVVVEPVLPVAHVHLFQAVVDDGLLESACCSKLACPCQWR